MSYPLQIHFYTSTSKQDNSYQVDVQIKVLTILLAIPVKREMSGLGFVN
jgi:hypothetical protein